MSNKLEGEGSYEGTRRYNEGVKKKIEKGEVGFEELEAYTFSNGEPATKSGRQEMLENLINEFL